MNKAISLMTLCAVLSLSACSHMNGQFDCPVGKGVSCKSMKEIDNMASQGYFKESPTSPTVVSLNKTAPYVLQNPLSTQAPVRVEARVLRVWFAPFVDSKDNYHQESEVFTVIDKSFWQGNPVQSFEGAPA